MNEIAKMRGPVIVTIGDLSSGEFSGPMADLRSRSQAVEIHSLLNENRTGETPDLIVVGLNRRGEFSQETVQRLKDHFPNAAIAVVYGPWCEGESRSGNPLTGVRRIPVRDWELEFDQFLEEFEWNGATVWRIGDTSTSEREAAGPGAANLPERTSIVVCVEAADPDMRDALVDLIHQQGWTPMEPKHDGLSGAMNVLVVDCRESVDEVARVSARVPMAIPVIALLGFPRQADRDALAEIRRGGKSRLVAKPWSNQLLARAIGTMAGVK
jgi:hypothetical protein